QPVLLMAREQRVHAAGGSASRFEFVFQLLVVLDLILGLTTCDRNVGRCLGQALLDRRPVRSRLGGTAQEFLPCLLCLCQACSGRIADDHFIASNQRFSLALTGCKLVEERSRLVSRGKK